MFGSRQLPKIGTQKGLYPEKKVINQAKESKKRQREEIRAVGGISRMSHARWKKKREKNPKTFELLAGNCWVSRLLGRSVRSLGSVR
jgi:hypothetical protein